MFPCRDPGSRTAWLGGAIGLGIAALAALGPGVPQALACGWWECSNAPPAYLPPGETYGFRPWAWGYRPAYRAGRRGRAYGYVAPVPDYGDDYYNLYAAWPSTFIPPSRWYLRTAPRVPNASVSGLSAPIASAQGLTQGGLPARGPSLFGPGPAPPAWGYSYGAPAYGYGPAYGYNGAPSYNGPPPDTASWWVEPRRRRR
jgi:hypothetical protein